MLDRALVGNGHCRPVGRFEVEALPGDIRQPLRQRILTHLKIPGRSNHRNRAVFTRHRDLQHVVERRRPPFIYQVVVVADGEPEIALRLFVGPEGPAPVDLLRVRRLGFAGQHAGNRRIVGLEFGYPGSNGVGSLFRIASVAAHAGQVAPPPVGFHAKILGW